MTDDLKRTGPIGVFDSGVGGLSVLKEIARQFPNEDIIYLADQVHVPYGSRELEEIQRFSIDITKYFIKQGAKLIVVACNTASAAALYHLREKFPHIPFVGMEPAVKPAAETTESGVVGVLATHATFQGELYSSVVERFAKDVKLIQDPCFGLVAEIEKGNLNGKETREILENALKPMMDAGIDTIVLGCTHYPFVFPLIEEIVGAEVRLIDPSPAIARQVGRLLVSNDLENELERIGIMSIYTTGDVEKLSEFLNVTGFDMKANSLKWGTEHGSKS
jgi:glutamate racemase